MFHVKIPSKKVLDQLYKLYVRPQLDYCDVIYHKHDQTFELEFTERLESVQYSAALVVSGVGRGQTRIDCIKNWARNLCIIGGGKDS